MAKYEFIRFDINTEMRIDDNTYSCDITIAIKPTDGIAPKFSKNITVISDNAQTGFEVDQFRLEAVNAFIDSINIEV